MSRRVWVAWAAMMLLGCIVTLALDIKAPLTFLWGALMGFAGLRVGFAWQDAHDDADRAKRGDQ